MLDSYLKRIGYHGPRTATLEVLGNIHRQHVLNISYENIDVLLQRPVDRSIEHIHNKLVTQQRGGWCYEMNGMLSWALDQLGFRVTQLCGGVMRQERGDATYGNHLLLRIDFAEANQPCQQWIADTGLGDGLLEPIPLLAASHQQRNATFSLVALDEPTDAQTWRFNNRPGGLPPSFDFINQTANQELLNDTCAALQSDPDSIFRRNLIVQRVSEHGAHLLLGRLYTTPSGERELLETEAQLAELLRSQFAIEQPPLTGPSGSSLWESVCDRHAELFGTTPANEIQLGPAKPEHDE